MDAVRMHSRVACLNSSQDSLIRLHLTGLLNQAHFQLKHSLQAQQLKQRMCAQQG